MADFVKMKQAWSDAESARQRALAAVSSGWDFFSSSKEQNTNYLEGNAKNYLAVLGENGWKWKGVLAGTFSESQWWADLKWIWNDMAKVSSEVGSWSWGGIVSSTLSATASTVKQVVNENAPSKGELYTVGVFVVVGLIALVILRLV